MIEFARNTPPEVAEWLRAGLAAVPNHPILRALATDERMSALWAELGKWPPGALSVVQLATHFSTPTILSILKKPSEERASPEYTSLGVAAEDFVMQLEWWTSAATELWGEPVGALVERLRAFATAAFERAKASQMVYGYIPEPNRRGRGNRKQLAFREALSRALQRLSEDAPLPKERQDSIIATITSVVFLEAPVDVETIKRHRQRQQRRQRATISTLNRRELSGDKSDKKF
jgi:hypothetical protein